MIIEESLINITNKNIDEGKPFDWGRTSLNYVRYRDIYPQFFYDKMPMSEFKQNIENLPYFIVEDIKHAKAKKLISKLKYPECVIFSEQRHTDKS